MRRPELEDFGVSQEDVDWANAMEDRLPMVLFVVCATGLGIHGLLTTTSFHLGLALLWVVFFGFPVALITSLLLCFPADFVVRLTLPRYRRAQRYLKALKQFRAWWIRTQQEFWRSLSGAQFEAELAALFRRAGFRAELTSASGDEGVDIWLYTHQGKEIVQCKARRIPIGPAVARELYGTLLHFGAPAATLASTSGFTKGVVDYVRDKPIKLLGLSDIIGLQERLSSGL